MKFNFTDAAAEELQKKQADHQLSLYYYSDASDCGCPATGIFSLRIGDEDEPEYDAEIATNLGTMKAQKWALVYLDKDNQVDFKKNQGTFVLKSERGYLNMNMPVENHTPSVSS